MCLAKRVGTRLCSALAVIGSFLAHSTADAAYREECRIRYAGTGSAYDVECIYLTGSELNEKTGSLSYSSFSLYVVVFWGEGRATVIKTAGINSCGLEATEGCAYSILPLRGLDQDEREWKICQSSHFICG